MKDTITISTWNCRGFKSSVPYIRELCNRSDIVLICEHWLHANCLSLFDEISDQTNFHARASNESNADAFGQRRGQGGVSIIWKREMVGISPMLDCVHDRVCSIRIQNKKGAVFCIFCVYLPAKGCGGDLRTCLDELSGLIENIELGAHIIVCGDFNGDMGSDGGFRNKRQCTREGVLVRDFMVKHNLFAANLRGDAKGPINTFFGPNGASCIDYALVSNDLADNVLECITFDQEVLNTSDHNPLHIKIHLGEVEKNTIVMEKKGGLRWNKLTPEKLLNDYTIPVGEGIDTIIDSLNSSQTTPGIIDKAFSDVTNILRKAERAIPRARHSYHIKPYWCAELDTLKKEKVRRFRDWCDAGRPRDPDNPLRKANCEAKKCFRKRIKSIAKAYEDKKICDATLKAEVDRNSFWRMLKKARNGNKVTISAVKNSADKVVHGIDEILEVWKLHFSTLCTPRVMPHYDQQHYEIVCEAVKRWHFMRDTDDFLNSNFTECEISYAINKLNGGKAPGYDGITREHLKAAETPIVKFLTIVLAKMLEIEYIPVNFRRGIQIPLYKGKNTSTLDPNNFRGITLLSTFNKIFEILLWARIEKWWGDSGVISETQGACRKGVSSLHTALLLQETIASNIEKGKKVFVTYLDVSKAFDRVFIEGLFYQLRKIGIIGKT